MNKYTCIGRLTAEPVERYTQGQQVYFTFRIAVSRRGGGNGQPEADFFNCSVFGRTAETFKKLTLTKGTRLWLCGPIQNNSYTDRNGVNRTDTQIVVNEFEILDSRQDNRQGSRPPEPAPIPNMWQPTNESSPFDASAPEQMGIEGDVNLPF